MFNSTIYVLSYRLVDGKNGRWYQEMHRELDEVKAEAARMQSKYAFETKIAIYTFKEELES